MTVRQCTCYTKDVPINKRHTPKGGNMAKIVIEVSEQAKQDFVEVVAALGFKTQKEWLLAKTEEGKKTIETTLEGENHCQTHP